MREKKTHSNKTRKKNRGKKVRSGLETGKIMWRKKAEKNRKSRLYKNIKVADRKKNKESHAKKETVV
jgi:hypothetical protein